MIDLVLNTAPIMHYHVSDCQSSESELTIIYFYNKLLIYYRHYIGKCNKHDFNEYNVSVADRDVRLDYGLVKRILLYIFSNMLHASILNQILCSGDEHYCLPNIIHRLRSNIVQRQSIDINVVQTFTSTL